MGTRSTGIAVHAVFGLATRRRGTRAADSGHAAGLCISPFDPRVAAQPHA